MSEGYDPRKSKVSDDRMEQWRTATVSRDLNTVPGLGPKAIEKLAEGDVDEKITNTYQLIGKFLMLKGPDSEGHQVESIEHAEKFWRWLKEKGIVAHRSAIVLAVAEKCATFFPEIYDAELYIDDDDEEEDGDNEDME